MLVQINTDKNIEGSSRFNDFFTEEINDLFTFTFASGDINS